MGELSSTASASPRPHAFFLYPKTPTSAKLSGQGTVRRWGLANKPTPLSSWSPKKKAKCPLRQTENLSPSSTGIGLRVSSKVFLSANRKRNEEKLAYK